MYQNRKEQNRKMAEKYGTVPKKFTSQWWSHFWDYYKWHTMGTAFAAVLVGVTVVQCATKEKFDMTVIYGGAHNFTEEESLTMEKIFEENSDDSDQNGENNVSFLPCMVANRDEYDEYTYAMQVKLDVSLQDEKTYLYLFDKEELDIMLVKCGSGEGFLTVDKFIQNPSEENIVTSENAPCAYNLKGSTLLNEAGIDCNDLYMAVKINTKGDDEEERAAFENAKKLASELAK